MNSSNDPLSRATEWETRSLTCWLRYVAVGALVLLIHDTLLTLDDEARLISSCFSPALPPVPRFALFGQDPFPYQRHCITSIAILPFSLLFIQPTVSSTFFGWWTQALKDYQTVPAFTHHSPIMWASFIHPLRPKRF